MELIDRNIRWNVLNESLRDTSIYKNKQMTSLNFQASNPFQLQYISQGKTIGDHLINIENVCKSGVKWVQLRLKKVSLIDYLEAAKKCRKICDTYGAVFIVNDNIGIAAESNADGVHLGLTDASPIEARKQLGVNAIIGGTANTLTNCLQHIEDGVDYIGLGPYRFTKTKDKLSPILGLEVYREIVNQLKAQEYSTPIIAIGGIQTKDVKELLSIGVSGIAVSGLLSNENEQSRKEIVLQLLGKNI